MDENTTTRLDPEFRFPKRLAKVQRIGCEIAREIGCQKPIGGGFPKVATLGEFYIMSFTPFDQPRGWRIINWAEKHIRISLYGLRIEADCGTCLNVIWTKDDQHFFFVRDPSENNWDQRLRKEWKNFQNERDRMERSLFARLGVNLQCE